MTLRIVSIWISMYTWLLPRSTRSARRRELRTDLLEQLADGDSRHAVLMRTVRGVPADIRWLVDRAVEDVHPLESPGLVLFLAAPFLGSLWLLGLRGHRTGGATEAIGTIAYFSFWFVTIGLIGLTTVSLVNRRIR